MTIKTNFIIICEQAFLTAGTNNLNLIGIFTNINAERFPFVYRHFALVINFDTDTMGAHTLRTQVIDEGRNELVKNEIRLNVNSSPFQIIANFENLSFPKPGKYKLRVMLDEKEIGAHNLAVSPVVSRKENIA